MRIGLHDEGLVLLTPEIPGEPSEAVRRERGGNGRRGQEASRTAQKIFLLLALFTFFPLHVNIMLIPFYSHFPLERSLKP